MIGWWNRKLRMPIAIFGYQCVCAVCQRSKPHGETCFWAGEAAQTACYTILATAWKCSIMSFLQPNGVLYRRIRASSTIPTGDRRSPRFTAQQHPTVLTLGATGFRARAHISRMEYLCQWKRAAVRPGKMCWWITARLRAICCMLSGSRTSLSPPPRPGTFPRRVLPGLLSGLPCTASTPTRPKR